MNNKKMTITVGISALNEGSNIKNLLNSIKKQHVENATLEKIILISDGSTDNTVKNALSTKIKILKVIDSKERLGKMKRENEILKYSSSDILVILDADVKPANNHFINELINPIILEKNVGLVGANIKSLPGNNLVQKSIAISNRFKQEIYTKINNGDNIYLCHGRARAFSKKYYKNLSWPQDFPEDAYSYLFCIKLGFKFAFAENAIVLYKSPSTINDHLKQSVRFKNGMQISSKEFSKKFVDSNYFISKKLFLTTLTKYIIKYPFYMTCYIAIMIYLRLFKSRTTIDNNRWAISSSTKEVIHAS